MNKHLPIPLSTLLLCSLFLNACGGGSVTASDLPRQASPAVEPGEVQQVAIGNTAFAFDLYRVLADTPGNHVFSPYSISTALAMTWAGARGNTASQMQSVLHFPFDQEQLHPAYNALDLDLALRPEQAAGVDEDDRFELSIANSLWGQEGWGFLPAYLDLLAQNYGAGLRLVDFENDPEAARQVINKWISDQTHKRIQDIIPPGSPDPSTRLALVNAIYFKAVWEHEFDHDATAPAPFTLLDGTPVSVDRMSMEHGEILAYAAGAGWQAVALPYKGGLTEMVLLVPDLGTFMDFESDLTSDRYAEILAALEVQSVDVSLPKFTFTIDYGLSEILPAMGMSDAFDPDLVDFSGMDGTRFLYIGDVLHKALIAVDEKGTEAAAATVVLMMLSSLPPEGIQMIIDRPFIYLIRDVPTGSLLFMGRVVDPR